ncbi:Sn1-specific diacylglycerol lipase beta [Heracleum sosnowskyi]|uniref:Sn1-specific diacylglycerol lipase beta n=1 Tax=Heracleum sosnowskyi TaxID=360622 RepID=A0AAD8I895_9APIA|nr:Sn1-specific diacylglycerol lipase beta [Heracleum sosnowskyi]
MRAKWVSSKLMKLRWSAVILGMLNMVVLILGIWIVCFVRIIAMVRTAFAQRATALLVVSQTPVADALVKRMRYKRWLWWTRAAMFITVLQLIGAIYLVFRCLAGSDVLRWRSFYTTQHHAWKTHYQEVFDYGLREALCCMGRAKYLTVLEEDEVYSVAQLLGDLVAYRASGTGHLELLAGLALLQRNDHFTEVHQDTVEAPEERVHEAVLYHPFAESAYTGLLLDFGRNPVLFPCAWLYRQGILTPWTRNRRPVLEGDNWWRGHAAAFLKDINLSPDVLRKGRVNQMAKCKAAYFVVVLHHLKSVVIAVRGTESPEDLITDALCRECNLTAEELDGLRRHHQDLDPSLSHYGHSGVVEAARDLFMQIEGNSTDSGGFLSSLLGAGCECEGYEIRVVGHSLGGAIGALLGLRLYGRFPRLHVYAYGPLPCMDAVIADACSEFMTSIVYQHEFSARLSVTSILRLRASALVALSSDSNTDSTTIYRLARRFLGENNQLRGDNRFSASDLSAVVMKAKETRDIHHPSGRKERAKDHGENFQMENSPCDEISCSASHSFINPFYESSAEIIEDPVSQFIEDVPSAEKPSPEDIPDLFLPGLVIHIVPERQNNETTLWKLWKAQENECSYRAYIANKDSFKDIVVSPTMFLDHLPWRCHYALKKVLETRHSQLIPDGPHMMV